MQFRDFVATDTTELDSWVNAVVNARKKERLALEPLLRKPSAWRCAGLATGAIAALSAGGLIGFAAAAEAAPTVRSHPAWAGSLLVLGSALFGLWRRLWFQRSRPKRPRVLPSESAFWLAERIARLRQPDVGFNSLPFIPWCELTVSALMMAFGMGLLGGRIAGGWV